MKKQNELNKIDLNWSEDISELAYILKEKFWKLYNINNQAWLLIAEECCFRLEPNKVKLDVKGLKNETFRFKLEQSRSFNHAEKWHDIYEYWIWQLNYWRDAI